MIVNLNNAFPSPLFPHREKEEWETHYSNSRSLEVLELYCSVFLHKDNNTRGCKTSFPRFLLLSVLRATMGQQHLLLKSTTQWRAQRAPMQSPRAQPKGREGPLGRPAAVGTSRAPRGGGELPCLLRLLLLLRLQSVTRLKISSGWFAEHFAFPRLWNSGPL